MPTIDLPFESLLEATSRLEPQQREILVRHLTDLKRNGKIYHKKREQAEVLARYNALTLSAEEWRRFYELIDFRRAKELTAAQHREFMALVKKNEEFDVKRLEILVEFGKKHGWTLPEVTRKLGLKAPEPIVI